MESYICHKTAPIFIHVPANVKTSVLFKAKKILLHVGKYCTVCPFRKSTSVSQGYSSEGGSDGTHANSYYFTGRKVRERAWLYDMCTPGKRKTKQNKLTVAEAELNPIGSSSLLYLNNKNPIHTTFPGSSHSWHSTNMGWLNESRRVIIIGRKLCIYGLNLSKHHMNWHGLFPRNY